MTRTNNGFEIAEVDMKLRGPGNMEGTQQSGLIEDLKLSDLSRDEKILQTARTLAMLILDKDPQLRNDLNAPLLAHLQTFGKKYKHWGFIS
jgi:ATP-dependent DNA helicase RecG